MLTPVLYFFIIKTCMLPAEYLFQFLQQAHKIFRYTSLQQYNKTMEALVHLGKLS